MSNKENQTMTFTGRTVQEARAKADAYFANVAAEVTRYKTLITAAEKRVSALEREKRGESDDLPQYYIPFNRTTGKTGDDR